MTKITKSFFAVIISVIMLISTVPNVFAATENVTFKVKSDKNGYTFDIYQLATLDTETGAYDVKVSSLSSVINSSNKTSKDILDAADALDAAALGTALKTYDPTVDGSEKEYTLTSGIYYFRANKKADNQSVSTIKNSVLALPFYSDDQWQSEWTDDTKTKGGEFFFDNVVYLGEKIAEGTPTSDKEITNSDLNDRTKTTSGIGKTVDFKLTANIGVDKANPLSKFTLVDKMSKGLTLKDDSIKIKDLAGNVIPNSSYTFTSSVNSTTNETDITVDFKNDSLAAENFYDYKSVIVTYSASVNDNAAVAGNGNNNTFYLEYANDLNDVHTTAQKSVSVYTFNAAVLKTIAGTSTPLSGAVFGLYSDANAATPIKNSNNNAITATTASDGKAVFSANLAKGTYYVKEIKAPSNYNLSSKVYEIVIDSPSFDAQGTVTSAAVYYANGDGEIVNDIKSIPNTKSRLPQTGAQGTMMFTIVGASLILVSGVLFALVIIAKRKKMNNK